MTIVAGFGPDVRSTAGVRFAGQLARTGSQELVLCCVVHDAFETAGLRDAHDADAEWREHLRSSAREALVSAQEAVAEGVRVTPVVRTGRSVPRGLQQEGEERGAELLVVGSAATGTLGRISLGSTSDRLVHSSPIPVAIAPQGFRDEGPLRRVVLAVEPTLGDVALAPAVAALARRYGAAVEVVTYVVRTGTALEALADQGVFDTWRRAVADAHRQIEVSLREEGVEVLGTHLLSADRWSRVLQQPEWQPGDAVVVGSSTSGPVARVFLGSTAARILRHAPVPVIALPRT